MEFTEIESTIKSIFDKIIQCALGRKNELLEEIIILKKKYKNKREETRTSITELEDKITKINAMKVTSDRAFNILQGRLITVNNELEELRKNIEMPRYIVEGELHEIIDSIRVLGSIITTKCKEELEYEPMASVENHPVVQRKAPPHPPPRKRSEPAKMAKQTPDYEYLSDIYTELDSPDVTVEKPKVASKPIKKSVQTKDKLSVKSFVGRKNPSLSFGKRGIKYGQLTQPRGIHFEPTRQDIYVVSRELRKVIVFHVTGDFRAEFGQEALEGPSCIATHKGICYITDDKLNSVIEFSIEDWRLLNITRFKRGIEPGKFKSLKGITVYADSIYLVDTGNNQVCIFNLKLSIESVLGSGVLQQPQDIAVRDFVYVLDLEVNTCVHTFSKEGEHVNSMINLTEISRECCIPSYLCVTHDELIILSILYGNTLIVFSKEGKLMQEIGSKKEVQSNTQGICITSDNKVVCVFAEGINCINIY
ncbi:hypothetical protein LOD99_8290 [Oopsacas minuta]|uniref:Uncharacterized protein n=1 Tax=Oopsacas minuta TaxID=111878 RepID=A0AAV7JGQ7_9METZ|nr:hypothetical protein LOD99_8290 [Oopsacas minuta]